jgi:hypothetical protein
MTGADPKPTSSQAPTPGAKAEAPGLRVFISNRDSTCDECKEELGPHAWIFLAGKRGCLCLACADLDHLVFLASGDAALTRRARKHSKLSAVVLKWSRARKQYERQGVLVEDEALAKAEAECLSDADARERRRQREAGRRAELDKEHVALFAARVRELFPAMPPGRETEIAEHACRKYSGRVGRSAAAKALDAEAVHLAVVAHVRHRETDYAEIMAFSCDRQDARGRVAGKVDEVLDAWERPVTLAARATALSQVDSPASTFCHMRPVTLSVIVPLPLSV